MRDPIILIPARLAASRLPGKPLADIAGEPMIVHVWRRAVEADVGPVVVATDSGEIAEAVRRAGGQAVMTRRAPSDPAPPASSRRSSALDPKRRHDVVVNVQGDLPTIEPAPCAPRSSRSTDPARRYRDARRRRSRATRSGPTRTS